LKNQPVTISFSSGHVILEKGGLMNIRILIALVIAVSSSCFASGCKTENEKCWQGFAEHLRNNEFQELKEHLNECPPNKAYVKGDWLMLHAAIHSNSIEAVKILIDGGADVNAVYHHPGGYGLAPLDVAVKNYCDEIIEVLKAHGGKEYDNKTPCEQKGGRWMGLIAGRGRIVGCNLPTKDGGKPCRSSDECESGCLRGKCYGWMKHRGCGMIVKNKDGVLDVMCTD
jgi:ankyrin repeat protein